MKTKHFISISIFSILTALLLSVITKATAQVWEREYDEVAESGCGVWELCETEDGYVYANLGKQNQMNLFKAKKKTARSFGIKNTTLLIAPLRQNYCQCREKKY